MSSSLSRPTYVWMARKLARRRYHTLRQMDPEVVYAMQTSADVLGALPSIGMHHVTESPDRREASIW